MPVVKIAQFEDTVVLHFQTDREQINAYTLASTLVAFADAAKVANANINAGYDIEIVIEALALGSFRAKLRAISKSAKNLFSTHTVENIILGILASYIYDRTLSVRPEVTVTVLTDEVIVEYGQDRVVVPRRIYEAKQVVEKDSRFRNAVGKAFDAIAQDDRVTGLALVRDIDSPAPEIVIPREALQAAAIRIEEEPTERVEDELCDLYIIKAILQRSIRKWEFTWRGVRISAPIIDDEFYSKFFSHQITIAPGDKLQVRLRIKQSRDPRTNIFTNDSYEVVEVFEHVAGLRQMPLNQSQDEP